MEIRLNDADRWAAGLFRIPADTAETIRRLMSGLEDFYRRWPDPDTEKVGAEGICAYTRLAGGVVSRLRAGDVALARFITYELPPERDLFAAMEDTHLLVGAWALTGAYGTREEAEALAPKVESAVREQERDSFYFPLGSWWKDLGMDQNHRLTKKWANMMGKNQWERFGEGGCGEYPAYLPQPRRIPNDAARFIRRLHRREESFLDRYPHPRGENLPEEGVWEYTKLTQPVVERLYRGDLALAQYLVYGIPVERDVYLEMGDLYIKITAEAIIGANGGKKTWNDARDMIQFYYNILDEDGFPLWLRWKALDPAGWEGRIDRRFRMMTRQMWQCGVEWDG